MNIKKNYAIGDTVWIYGIARTNKLTKGKIIHEFTPEGYEDMQYIIEVPTSIAPLLEVREWSTISQDSTGPIGSMREMIAVSEMDAANKKMSQAGYEYDPAYEIVDDEPTPEQIHAALERDQRAVEHAPLMVKDSTAKPKSNRRYTARRKKP